MKKLTITDILVLLFLILIPQLVGYLGSFSTIDQIDTWYANLNAPSFAPPPEIFGPVWIVLYTLIGIATFLVWREYRENKNKYIRNTLIIFFVHLLFNAIWTPIFFGLENLLLAFVDIIIVLILASYTLYRYYKVNRTSSYLFLPYILWVAFATILNLGYLLLN